VSCFSKKCKVLVSCLTLLNLKTGYASNTWIAEVAVPAMGYLYSLSIHDIEGVKELTYSCAFTAQLTTLTKNTVRRTRPDGSDSLSFPSGHAAGSFTGASYFHHRYGIKWGLPMYGVATAISIQRINGDKHYWTDVIAGAALGYLSGYLFCVRYPDIWIAPNFSSVHREASLQFSYAL